MPRKKKITLESLGEYWLEGRPLTSWRPHPELYSMIKKRALKEDMNIRKMLEKMAIFYLNESKL
jgi:hypothetical protein